ncbi:MAG: 6-phosphogluconolactonase [Steroidobacteraceae bacterium]
MRLKIAHDPGRAAEVAAADIAHACADAVASRGTATVAMSGGETPWLMLRELCRFHLPWAHICVAQVDERVAPRGDPSRNLTLMERILVHEGPLPAANLLAMPVERADLDRAAADYQRALESQTGTPVRFDLVQLGLGADGHTASLVPGDAALHVLDRDTAVTGEYHGQRRMTLTLPAINRARRRLWLVTGMHKRARLAELLAASGSAPALPVSRTDVLVVADEDAAGPGLRDGPYPG